MSIGVGLSRGVGRGTCPLEAPGACASSRCWSCSPCCSSRAARPGGRVRRPRRAATPGDRPAGSRARGPEPDAARGHQQRRHRRYPRLRHLAPAVRRHRLRQPGRPQRRLHRGHPRLRHLAPELRADGPDGDPDADATATPTATATQHTPRRPPRRHPSARAYVANFSSNNVTVFSTDASGNILGSSGTNVPEPAGRDQPPGNRREPGRHAPVRPQLQQQQRDGFQPGREREYRWRLRHQRSRACRRVPTPWESP